MTVVYGFICYYLMPKYLLTVDYGNMLRIFLFMIIGMVVGMCMLVLNLQTIMEWAIVKFYMIFEHQSLKKMVRNNLKHHRSEQKLTSLVYSIAFGMIIFMVAAYTLVLKGLNA